MTRPVKADGFQALLLDLDGTLIDTLPDISQALGRLLNDRGLELLDDTQLRRLVGGGTRAMLQAVCANAQLPWDEQWHEQYLRLYEQCLLNRSRPFDGVLALLEHCRDRALPMAVVTNKSQAMASRLLDALLPTIPFVTTVGASASRPLKPNPQGAFFAAAEIGASPECCLLLGDTQSDVLTAPAAGMRAGAALWGYGSRQSLMALSPHAVFEEPGQLASFLFD